MTELVVDWCSYQAAKFAVEHWHYSKTLPTGKNNYIGVWECGNFIGCVIFGSGATGTLGKPYGLTTFEIAELRRVALDEHTTAVTQIVSVAIKMIKSRNPGLRLLISFADPHHDHVGGIYQAGNWIYTGTSQDGKMYLLPDGSLIHPRRFTGVGWNAPKPIPFGAVKIKTPGKHRYLYPLDRAMRRQIEPLRKPYPKRGRSIEGDTSAVQVEGAGSTPAARS